MLPHHKEPSSRHALKGQKHLAQGNTLGISAIRPAPCKGKSLKYMLLYNQFYLGFARNFPIFLQIPILFRTFAVVLLWMAGDESLAR